MFNKLRKAIDKAEEMYDKRDVEGKLKKVKEKKETVKKKAVQIKDILKEEW